MFQKTTALFFLLQLFADLFAQSPLTDTNKVSHLPAITVLAYPNKKDVQPMPEISGLMIFASKKSSLIIPEKIQGNVLNNSMRQVMAKVPGIHVWENDGSGIQIGIAARGLSPNRSWDFNVRQNGYDIAADPYGYPEAYYHPPMSGVQRIEVVRGQGALQYGPQLGGMVNYILKDGSDLSSQWQGETISGLGSNGLINQFISMGKKIKQGQIFAFYDHRHGDGWRENSRFVSDAAFLTATDQLSAHLKLSAELLFSNTKSQQAGGLTDSLFSIDAKQSFRARNWFTIQWLTPSLNIQYAPNERTIWNTRISSTLGKRNSVGMMADLLVKDSINSLTFDYSNRNVQRDQYQNLMIESRLLHHFVFKNQQHSFSGGLRFYQGNTWRRSNGKGTTGPDADMSVLMEYPSDLRFRYFNYAFFAENIFRISKRFSVVPGMRVEWLEGRAAGRNGWASDGKEINLSAASRRRKFILTGLGTEYKLTASTILYANITESYRPIQFSNLQVVASTDSIDANLQDAKGFNADLGYKGQYKDKLMFDISVYYLSYQNRIGTITPAGATKRVITNLGNSVSKGLESYVEWNIIRPVAPKQKLSLSMFTAYSYTDARYSGDFLTTSVKGKQVENAPKHILRPGMNLGYAYTLLTTQFNYVHGTFSDANNTVNASANGQTGWIPSYRIWDMTLQQNINDHVQIKAGANNVFDARYFTRRAGGYPGPGLLPADGRTYFLTLNIQWN